MVAGLLVRERLMPEQQITSAISLGQLHPNDGTVGQLVVFPALRKHQPLGRVELAILANSDVDTAGRMRHLEPLSASDPRVGFRFNFKVVRRPHPVLQLFGIGPG